MSTPKVNTREIDLTFSIQSITSNATGFVGLFRWGPAEQIVTLTTNEDELVQRFGEPNTETSMYFHAVSNYMLYSVPVKVVRVVGENALNSITETASAGGESAVLVKNDDEYDDVTVSQFSTQAPSFIARYPGELGNTLKVSVAGENTFEGWTYEEDFEFAPQAGELNVAVIDEDGLITGTPGQILETYELLTTNPGDTKPDGTKAYIKDVFQEQSQYLLVVDESVIDATSSVFEESFVDGADDNDEANVDFVAGVNMFENKDSVEIFRMMTSGMSDAGKTAAIDLAVSRGDFVVFVAPELADVYNNTSAITDVKEYFNDTLNKPESYNFQVDNWKLVNDRYNNTEVWIPCDSDAAGLHARLSELWFSPAGLNRGRLKNVIKLAYNPNETQRNGLYKDSINSIISIEGEGTVLWGDRTALKRPSAFRQLGVRSLFIILRKNIANAARYQLFELNDPITWSQFRNPVNQYLENVKGRRGIIAKRVVADETNNTAGSEEFVGDIYIKPNKSIQQIRLNFVAVGPNVDFEEIEGNF